jgi:hypothetical protein
MKFSHFIYLLIFTILFNSCSEDFEDFSIDNGKNFYPLQVGLNTTYLVDSTIYDPFQQEIIFKRKYLREFIESTFLDDAGNINYRLERYSGDSESDVNTFSSVWSISTGERFVDRIESNLRFNTMIFPVFENANWLGHKFIVADANLSYLKDWKFTYLNLNKSFTLEDSIHGNKDFDTTVTIRQFGDSTNIIQTRGKEVYAKDIGLVFKTMTFLDGSTPCRRLCPEQSEACVNSCFTLPLDIRADNGFIVTIRYIKHEVLP